MGMNVSFLSKISCASQDDVAPLSFCGHLEAVLCVAVAKDGTMIATCGMDRTVRLWNAPASSEHVVLSSKREMVLVGHQRRVNCLAFNPCNSTVLASASDDRSIIFWNPRDGLKVAIGREHTGPVQTLAFNQDGSLMASGGGDCSICLWDTTRHNSLVRVLKGHTGYIFCLAFCCDGQTLVSGSGDRTIRRWHCNRGDELADPLRMRSTIMCLSMTPAMPDIVVAGCVDGSVNVWNLAQGQAIQQPIAAHSDAVSSLRFGPDGTTLFSASRDHTLRLWDLQSENDVSYSPDERKPSAPCRQNRVLHRFHPSTGYIHSIAFLSDDSCLASAHGDGTVRLTPLRGCCDACGVRVERCSAASAVPNLCSGGNVFATGHSLTWACCDCAHARADAADGDMQPSTARRGSRRLDTAADLHKDAPLSVRRTSLSAWIPTPHVMRVRPPRDLSSVRGTADGGGSAGSSGVRAEEAPRCAHCTGRRRLAVAMALHLRLGSGTLISQLKLDTLQFIISCI